MLSWCVREGTGCHDVCLTAARWDKHLSKTVGFLYFAAPCVGCFMEHECIMLTMAMSGYNAVVGFRIDSPNEGMMSMMLAFRLLKLPCIFAASTTPNGDAANSGAPANSLPGCSKEQQKRHRKGQPGRTPAARTEAGCVLGLQLANISAQPVAPRRHGLLPNGA